jgi:hypothetical protein
VHRLRLLLGLAGVPDYFHRSKPIPAGAGFDLSQFELVEIESQEPNRPWLDFEAFGSLIKRETEKAAEYAQLPWEEV